MQLIELLEEVVSTLKNNPEINTLETKVNSTIQVADVLRRKCEELEGKVFANKVQQQDFAKEIRSLVDKLQVDIASTALVSQPSQKYHYELDPRNPDESWDKIIKEGQAIQRPYNLDAEAYWQNKQGDSPSGKGWYGTVGMPVITIVANAPEYDFRSTKRLPGRFRLWSPTRWGSTLRFHCDIGPTLHDNWTNSAGIPYGFKTNAPIGLYVEPTTYVDEQFTVRPFEQSIENCLIVAHNGTLPIYLADNQDRLWIRDCNIQQHQGAQVGIKHGPPIRTSIIRQAPMANVYLADPKFIDLQMEGPTNSITPQAAIFASGNNIHMRGLNLYGWLQGPYLHGGNNRYVQVQAHKSNTHDGRVPLRMEHVCGATLNQYKDHEFCHVVGAEKELFPTSYTTAPRTMGTHQKGEVLYGG